MTKIIAITIGIFFALISSAMAATWKIDPDHSEANFAIKHMAISKVKGSFSSVTGKIIFNNSTTNPFLLEITIEAASIDTGVEKRDIHLKSPDFFDVNKYSTLHFISKKVTPIGQGKYEITGDLSMHGVTKELSLTLEGLEGEAKDPWGNLRKGAHITGKINRKDYGIVYNVVLESGNILIGETADISVDLELLKN